ncbi:MAG: NAD(P)H-hydrate dehydratase [Weeksellaceae bacterium]
MKILNPEQLKIVEKETAAKQNIEMIDLMKRAATAVFDQIKLRHEISNTDFVIFCGSGNNGGDGLVLSRLIKNGGSNPKVYLLKTHNYSADNLTNQKRLKETGVEIEYFDENTDFDFSNQPVIIDAIFGYGLNRPVDGGLKTVIEKMNHSNCEMISVDLPSGMFCDRLNSTEDSIVQSDLCLTFDSPKLSMLLSENSKNIRDFKILDIGFDRNSIESQSTEFYFTDLDSVSGLRKRRDRFGYKYNYGNLLVIGGSHGKMGSVIFSAKAAMRCGAGLVTAYIPKCGSSVLQSIFPEVMLMTDFSDDKIIGFPKISRFDTIAIGPGLGTDERTEYGFEQFLSENEFEYRKIIIDADGINLLSKNKNLLKILPENTIITPHDRELERLIGSWNDSIEKFKKIKNLSKEFGLIVVSKGAFSQIHTPDGETHFNSTGNPGMATAGSGDVLTGMIAGLIGRGHAPKEAAILGVYLHGLCGDLAAYEMGEESLIASDLIDFIPTAFQKTFGKI